MTAAEKHLMELLANCARVNAALIAAGLQHAYSGARTPTEPAQRALATAFAEAGALQARMLAAYPDLGN